MNLNKYQKTILRKVAPALILAAVLALSFPPKTEAALWPGMDPEISQTLTVIYDHIQGTVLASLQQQAAVMLSRQATNAIAGNSLSSAGFITNWQAFLYTDPQKQATTYMNDYLSQMTQGKGSPTGYISEGFSGSGTGNYAAQLKQSAQAMINNQNPSQIPQLTYQGDPSQMFASSNFQNMLTYMSGINNPMAFNMAAQSAYETQLTQLQTAAQAQAIAYNGVKGKTVTAANGQQIVTNPGSLIMRSVSSAQNISSQILASATHPEQIITAAVSQLATQAIQMGLGQVQSYVNQEINNPQKNQTRALNNQSPAAQYGTGL